jgi:hypothetical protein
MFQMSLLDTNDVFTIIIVIILILLLDRNQSQWKPPISFQCRHMTNQHNVHIMRSLYVMQKSAQKLRNRPRGMCRRAVWYKPANFYE